MLAINSFDQDIDYYSKYLKYKSKYEQLKTIKENL
jgi:hypothetical protein